MNFWIKKEWNVDQNIFNSQTLCVFSHVSVKCLQMLPNLFANSTWIQETEQNLLYRPKVNRRLQFLVFFVYY